MAAMTPERQDWLALESDLDDLGLMLLRAGDTGTARACFDLAATIDDAYGMTTAELKASVAESLKGTPYEGWADKL